MEAADWKIIAELAAGLPEIRLVAIADVNEALGADAARRYGYERAETGWEAIAAAPDIDAVSAGGAELEQLSHELERAATAGGELRHVAEELGQKAAEMTGHTAPAELSPREDFLPFYLHPRADKAAVAAFRNALDAAGV